MAIGLIFSLIIAAAWLFNIIMWTKGFISTGKALSKKNTGMTPWQSTINNIADAAKHFIFTIGDIGAVGLVKYLIGTYATSVLASSIISVGISGYIWYLRKKADEG